VILVAGCAAVLLSVPLAGGRFERLAELRISHAHLVFAALALQVAVLGVLPAALPQPVAAALHLLSLAFALGFVWCNRRVAGIALLATGAICNVAAIAANGGVMPASPSAMRRAGLAEEVEGFRNSATLDGPELAFLGDVFAIPEGWPLANVFSVGDVLLLAGAAVALHAGAGSRLAGSGRRAASARL
jgi:hypothetical protein